MNTVLVGSGNVAESLAVAISECPQLHLVQICARNRDRGKLLAERCGAEYVQHPEDVADAEIYVVAVSDGAVSEIASRLCVPRGSTVVHTSGGTDIEVLACVSENRGVFYPLQTFTVGRTVDFRKTPVFIEYSNLQAERAVRNFAAALSDDVYEADSVRRCRLHVAAVFACNFTNHLYVLAERLLSESGVGFEVLKPLIRETVDKALSQCGPEAGQTGPASRHDGATVQRHLNLLHGESDTRYFEIYKLLNDSIWETSKKI